MTGWVVLLRGVNVGGANRLPMADFRTSVESRGYTDVGTYIQSGNVVFRGDASAATIVRRLRGVLSDRHGRAVPVVARRSTELAGARRAGHRARRAQSEQRDSTPTTITTVVSARRGRFRHRST